MGVLVATSNTQIVDVRYKLFFFFCWPSLSASCNCIHIDKKKKKNPKINPTSTKNIKNDAMLITRKKCDVFGPKFIPNTSTFLPFFDWKEHIQENEMGQ